MANSTFFKELPGWLSLFSLKIQWIVLVFFCLFFSSCNHKENTKDHPALLDKITDSASFLVDQHNLRGAIKYFDKRYNAIADPGLSDELKKYTFKEAASYKIGKIDNNKATFAWSLMYADSMLSLIQENKAENRFKYENAVAHFVKGDILFEFGRYEEAYRYFYDGKMLANKLADKCSRSLFEDRFALLCYHQDKFKQAASLFLQAYNDKLYCNIDFDNFAATQGAMDNAGLSYERIGLADSALDCFKRALIYISKNAGRFPGHARFITDAYGVTYGDLGRVYLDRGNMAAAETFFKKSIALNSHGGNEAKNTQVMQIKLARGYLETSRTFELDSLLKGIRASLDTLPNEQVELDWQKLSWNFFNAIKQPQKANIYLQAYLKLKDTADARERRIAVADAGSSFQHLQQNYDLEILKGQNKLNSVYLFFTIGFSLLALFTVFQVWRNWRISTKSNRDLTVLNHEIVERNLTLQRALNALEQSQEENTSIMEVVAHDLRSPIGAIVSLADLVVDSDNLSEEDKKMIRLIHTSGTDSLKFINELLNRESAAKELRTEEVNLGDLLTNCVAQLQFRANEKQQRIILKSQPVILQLNREKIWRVLSNLITNSIKFSPAGADIDVSMAVNGHTITIAVKDSGIGIPDELKDKIFNMVSKAKRAGTDGEKSFGLGLAISKQIVEAHDGKLWFESHAKQGVTFYIELPLN